MGFADGLLGTIRIEARRMNATQIELVIADDGSGMSEEVQRRAFDPFFTTRADRGGTGLGLHIVYNLVTRRLGGRITFCLRRRAAVRRSASPCRVVAPRAEAAVPDEALTATDR